MATADHTDRPPMPPARSVHVDLSTIYQSTSRHVLCSSHVAPIFWLERTSREPWPGLTGGTGGWGAVGAGLRNAVSLLPFYVLTGRRQMKFAEDASHCDLRGPQTWPCSLQHASQSWENRHTFLLLTLAASKGRIDTT
jgi:hypothetical protein